MDDNIVLLDIATTLDIDPQNVIEGATEAKLESVVVVGLKDTGELYFASSVGGNGDIIWLLECAKKHILDLATEDY